MNQLPLALGGQRSRRELAPGALLLPGFALPLQREILAALDGVVQQAPFRRMETPGGHRMSVEMTNCGPLGWVTDARGYRYAATDPQSDRPWPDLPQPFAELARAAAAEAGYAHFEPDACLVNRYVPGARMTLHQDRNERDFTAPIVSVSLGIDAVFLFGGESRGDAPERIRLEHGDVVVWGGPSRLRFHGVLPLRPAHHPATGACRINLTFRRAG